ncbi:MAG: PQQ-binding-like beta-propeller repeat protein [Cytophagales bacterium]|nr:PQQ-binding-like beta-propeller repeat protein [Cytophagales bacterium]
MSDKTRFENELAVWETQTDDYVAGAGWSFDSRLVYAASSAGHFYMYEAASGKPVFSEQVSTEGINTIAVSPVAHQIAIAGKDGKIQLRHGETGQLTKTLEGGALWVEHVAWSADGQHLATAAGKTLRLWTTGGELAFEYKEFSSTISALFWRDGSHLAVACYGTIALFDVRRKAEVFAPHEILFWKTPMISLSWRTDGAYLLAGTQDARIQVWRFPFTPGSELEMSGYSGKVKELSWHAGQLQVATNCGSEIVIWDTSGKGPEGQKPTVLRGHVAKITKLAFQHRGDLIISCDAVGLVLIRHPKNPNIRVEGVSESPVCQLAWSPDDEYVLLGTEKGEIMLWETPF